MTVWNINEKQPAGKVGGGTAELSPPRRPTLLTGRRKSHKVVWIFVMQLINLCSIIVTKQNLSNMGV